MPGQQWTPIRDREARRRRRVCAAFVVAAAAVVLLAAALWTLAQERLGADSRTVTFVAAAAGVAALLAALAEILGYLRGKQQPR